jgi:hypothetical protein
MSMAGRITGPYKGFFINASAALNGNGDGQYVGTLSLTEDGVDEPRKLERLVPLGPDSAFSDDTAALEQLEASAREYIDALLSNV